MDGGFAGASMERIARDAGVSKATLYSHFADKEALFFACIFAEVERHRPRWESDEPDRRLIRARLEEFGRGLLSLLSRPDIHQFGRLLSAQAAHHPRLAELFYEAGPASMCSALTALIAEGVQRGELTCADPTLAADQLVCMWKGMHHLRQELGLAGPRSEAEIKKHVAGCTELFLTAYGTDARG
jgi:TetR/AcrR family transcriptional regulator, mexJK operon transcriptional repressor